MKPGIIIAIIILILIIIATIIINHLLTKKVSENSDKIKQLKKLNTETKFENLDNEYTIFKQYDNKSSYNKIDPSFLMRYKIKENIAAFTNICDIINRNRRLEKDYLNKINLITSTVTKQMCKILKIPYGIFKAYEQKIFKKLIIKPTTNYTFTVKMRYVSPKGKVDISKIGVYYFDDVFTCLNSISRSGMDNDIRRSINLVERGNMSDSMRYDVLRRDGFKCVICGASQSQGVQLHVDHIIPVSKGGKSVMSNLRTLCERCNIGKSDKIETISDSNNSNKQSANTCPNCGSILVLKKGKYGDFFGCSNYPNCRYTRKRK